MKWACRTSCLFLGLLLFTYLQVWGQKPVFTNVELPEGVNLAGINKIVQDQQGFIWLATINGLHRYDGYHFLSYYNNPQDKSSIASDNITALVVSKNGVLWIGTKDNGLDRFDPVTKTFTHYQNIPRNSTSLSHNRVNAILEDKSGVLWVGTQKGLNRFIPSTKTFIHYLHHPGNPSSLSNDEISTLYQDKKGILWIGTTGRVLDISGNGGLNRFNAQNGSFTRYLHQENNPNSLLNNKVRAIFEDSRGVFWVGTSGDGLHTMDRENGSFRRHQYQPNQPNKLSRAPFISNNILDGVTFIHEDVTGAIWIGTYGSGLSRYDPNTNKVVHLTANSKTSSSLENNYFSSAYNSQEGVLWVSTFHGGQLYHTNPVGVRFNYNATGSQVRTLLEDKTKRIWAGTRNGLKIYSLGTEGIQVEKKTISIPSNLAEQQVWSILQDEQGTIWLGGKSGLWRHKPGSSKFDPYPHNPFLTTGPDAGAITRIMAGRNGVIWIGTNTSGLSRINTRNDKLTRYKIDPENPNNLSHDFISAIYEDNKGTLWVGNWSGMGLHKLNNRTGNFKHYLSNGKTITSIQEDASGRIWAGSSEQGLFLYDPNKDNFFKYKDKRTGKQLPYSVKGMLVDDQGFLWVHTTKGLSKLDREANLIATYGAEIGLILSEFTLLAAHKGKNGRLYFGDINGFYTFTPQESKSSKSPPKIQLTDFRLLGGLEMDNDDLRERLHLAKPKDLKLNHSQNSFTFDFAGIHFAQPEQNSHYYKLENYDNNWREAKSEPTATYFKVPYGSYKFRIKAVSSEGVWAERSLNIAVLPPWWQTWWAYTLYLVLFIFCIGSYVQFRSRQLRKEKQLLELKINVRTEEVLRQKEEIASQRDNLENTLTTLKETQVQLIQSEKMASLVLLTAGIAHEIQNPLNFVNNFADINIEIINELEEELDKGNVDEAKLLASDIKVNEEKIYHHGKRADTIVKGMLQHSHASLGLKELTDINALIKEYLRVGYYGLRVKNNDLSIDLITDIDESMEPVAVVPQDLGRVLLNLLNNAFYAVQQKQSLMGKSFKPEVQIRSKKIENKAQISIKDNGNGIPDTHKEKIFQPFFTTKPTGQGTGLGLYISYDIITKGHGGELQVKSEPGFFAEFIIKLPLEVKAKAE